MDGRGLYGCRPLRRPQRPDHRGQQPRQGQQHTALDHQLPRLRKPRRRRNHQRLAQQALRRQRAAHLRRRDNASGGISRSGHGRVVDHRRLRQLGCQQHLRPARAPRLDRQGQQHLSLDGDQQDADTHLRHGRLDNEDRHPLLPRLRRRQHHQPEAVGSQRRSRHADLLERLHAQGRDADLRHRPLDHSEQRCRRRRPDRRPDVARNRGPQPRLWLHHLPMDALGRRPLRRLRRRDHQQLHAHHSRRRFAQVRL